MNNDAEKIDASTMSMRDVFASRAITGLVSGVAMAPNGTRELVDLAEQRGMAPHEVVAVSAYRYADAMLKARVSTLSVEAEGKISRERLAGSGVKPAPDSPTVIIGYTNWRGEYGEREIVPMSPWFGATEWHSEPQWLLKAWDVDKDAERDFAVKHIGFMDAAIISSEDEAVAWLHFDAECEACVNLKEDAIEALDPAPGEDFPLYTRPLSPGAMMDIESVIDAVMDGAERYAPKVIPMGANPPMFDSMQPDYDGPWVSRVDVAKRLRAALAQTKCHL